MARRCRTTAIAPPFRFLDLPRETRDQIYRLLLTTPYTGIKKNQWGSPKHFKLHTAILFANKQLHDEARETFFFDNDFIVLKIIGGWTTFNYIHTVKLPTFHNLEEELIERPVLKATLEELGPEEEELDEHDWPSHRKDTCKTIITTTDVLFEIKEALWRLAKKGMNFRDWSLKLDVQQIVSGRPAALRDQVLSQCDQIQGFRRFTLTGDVPPTLAGYLQSCMARGPPLPEIAKTADDLVRTGERCFQQRRCKDTQTYWAHARRFLYYRYYVLFNKTSSAGIIRSFQPHHIHFLKATLPLVIKAHLGLFHLDLLHFDERDMNSLAMKRQFIFVEDLIDFFKQDCNLSPMLVARFHVCNNVAHLLLGHAVAAKATLAQVLVSLTQDKRQKEEAMDLVQKLEVVNLGLMKELQTEAREASFLVLFQSSEPPAIDYGCLDRRSFWEWLEVVEEALPYKN
jgi:hypothetical protein